MPVPCPCCRASNDTGPNCRRCKADLSLLFQLEANREQHLASARTAVAAGRLRDAETSLARAAEIRRGADVSRLRAAVALLGRDFAAAYARWTSTPSAP